MGGTVEETARQSDHVSGQHEVDDLPFTVAQQLVTRRETVLDEAQFAVFVAVVHEIAPLLHRLLNLDDGTQALQVGQGEIDEVAQARDEGIVAPDVLGRPGGAAYCNRSQGNIVHITNLDQ